MPGYTWKPYKEEAEKQALIEAGLESMRVSCQTLDYTPSEKAVKNVKRMYENAAAGEVLRWGDGLNNDFNPARPKFYYEALRLEMRWRRIAKDLQKLATENGIECEKKGILG